MIGLRTSAQRITALGVAVYWIGFWWCFSKAAIPVPPMRVYEDLGFMFEFFHRGIRARTAFETPWIASCFWCNLPCWVLTWPLGRLYAVGDVLESAVGMNLSGARLLLVNILSFLQWSLIISFAEWLWRSLRTYSRT